MKLHALDPYKATDVDGYRVLILPVKHAVPAVGYQITSKDGKVSSTAAIRDRVCLTVWEHISPQLLIIDVTMSNGLEEHAIPAGHLTPHLLGEELRQFKKTKGYLPPVIIIHLSAMFEKQIGEQAAQLAKELGAKITLGREGMVVRI